MGGSLIAARRSTLLHCGISVWIGVAVAGWPGRLVSGAQAVASGLQLSTLGALESPISTEAISLLSTLDASLAELEQVAAQMSVREFALEGQITHISSMKQRLAAIQNDNVKNDAAMIKDEETTLGQIYEQLMDLKRTEEQEDKYDDEDRIAQAELGKILDLLGVQLGDEDAVEQAGIAFRSLYWFYRNFILLICILWSILSCYARQRTETAAAERPELPKPLPVHPDAQPPYERRRKRGPRMGRNKDSAHKIRRPRSSDGHKPRRYVSLTDAIREVGDRKPLDTVAEMEMPPRSSSSGSSISAVSRASAASRRTGANSTRAPSIRSPQRSRPPSLKLPLEGGTDSSPAPAPERRSSRTPAFVSLSGPSERRVTRSPSYMAVDMRRRLNSERRGAEGSAEDYGSPDSSSLIVADL